ncbi:bifunctional DNA primase/polymerase [Streptomyces sp. NPDC048248]|uniref:bifunctional DNA primase/polymerase n=1 Tax=Streptomyces sp. NPDC048248 TaxID=3365523 RepID=UPI00371AA896
MTWASGQRLKPAARPSTSQKATISTTRSRPDTLTVAQRWATARWSVQPLTPGRETSGRHCRVGEATGHTCHNLFCPRQETWCRGFRCTTERLRAWWKQNCDFGLHVACGPAGLVVADIETHATAPPSHQRLLRSIPVHDDVDRHGVDSDHHTARAQARQIGTRADGGYIALGTMTADDTYIPIGPCRKLTPLPTWLSRRLVRTGLQPFGLTTLPSARQAPTSVDGGREATKSTLETLVAAIVGCTPTPEGAGFCDELHRAALPAGCLTDAGRLSQDAAKDMNGIATGARRPLYPGGRA